MNEEGKGGWALFDLDQTIVPWDMQALFCNFVLRREGWRRILLIPFFLLLPFAKVLGSEVMKRVFLGFLWTMRREEVAAYAGEFAEHYIPTICYPEVLEELERNKRAGRRTVLVSASPEIYVRLIGERLGFDRTFGTVVEWQERVPWFPRMPLGNNKSGNKVIRLRDELGLRGRVEDSVGYSDSAADLPMLELCEEVVAVHPEGRFLERVKEEGWRILQPEKPWANRGEFGRDLLKMMLGFFR